MIYYTHTTHMLKVKYLYIYMHIHMNTNCVVFSSKTNYQKYYYYQIFFFVCHVYIFPVWVNLDSSFFMWFIFHVLKKGLNICDYFNVTYSILRNFSRLFLWNNIHPSVNSLRAKITGTGERDCKPSSYKKIGNKKKHF